MAVTPSNIAFDIRDPLPLKGFPSGKYRIRMSPDSFVAVFVKTLNGISEFRVKEEDGFWVPFCEVARNLRGEIEE